MNEMPNLPAVAGCPCFPEMEQDGCVCGKTERVLRAWMCGKITQPMTPEQREYCYAELDSVEGHHRPISHMPTDVELAREVLAAWQDYCRDQGLI